MNVVVVLSAIPFYFKYVLGITKPSTVPIFGYKSDEDQFTLLLGTMLLCTFVGLLVWVQILKKLGPLRTWKLSCGTTLITLFYFLFVAKDFITGWVGMVFYGVFVPGNLLSSTLIYSQVVDEDEINTGKRREGLFNGVNTMLTKFCSVPLSLAMAVMLSTTGYIPGSDDQPASAVWGIRALVTIFPMFSTIFIFYCLHRYPLQGEKLKEHQAQVQLLHDRRVAEMVDFSFSEATEAPAASITPPPLAPPAPPAPPAPLAPLSPVSTPAFEPLPVVKEDHYSPLNVALMSPRARQTTLSPSSQTIASIPQSPDMPLQSMSPT
eukprot:TRINITY_DN2917_c0_g1_i3.p2 TRINITY_DN2917_c0_g1~~TRINITY_DN2917_c0_g1_i3.p2  ORF type:complete len:321 (-),score=66.08 TRINITY_DN2917_c0_g1_i3:12-974(-)